MRPFLLGLLTVLTLIMSSCAASRSSWGPVTTTDNIRSLTRRGLTQEAALLLHDKRAKLDESEGYALEAAIAEKEGLFSRAADSWRQAARLAPDSVRFWTKRWSALIKAAGIEKTKADILHNLIREEGASFAVRKTERELYLAHAAAALLGDSIAQPRADKLIKAFPQSEWSNEIIGGRFWDGMYPIWTNDTAKVGYFRDFIEKYPHSDWATFAYRNLIGTYLNLKDTASAVMAANEMIVVSQRISQGNSPGTVLSDLDPLVLSHAVGYLFDVPGQQDSVRIWAELAYALRGRLTRPDYYTPEEWQLVETAARASIPLTLAAIYLRVSSAPTPNDLLVGSASPPDYIKKARKLAEESYALADYDIDDNNTTAPQHLMLGRIFLAEGDSSKAALHWTRAAVAGDVYNRFAGKAIDSLKAVFNLKDEKEVLAFCRKKSGYDGITFDRVTAEVGLDSARGGRVAWGYFDYEPEREYEDLLAGGTALFTNYEASFRHKEGNSGLRADGCHGGIFGDYNNDGTTDLFAFSSSGDLTNSERLISKVSFTAPFPTGAANSPPILQSILKDVTSSSPSLPDSFSTESVIWFDANGDGLLDLYIPGYERPAVGADDLGNAWPSRLMVQDNAGVFHDSTEAFNLVPKDGKWFCARSPVACDFDRDGDQDLYVGNYRLQENQFFVNNSPPAVNIISSAVTARPVTETVSGDERPPVREGAKHKELHKLIDNLTPEEIERIKLRGETGQRVSETPNSQLPTPNFENLAALYMIDGDESDGWWGHTIGCEWGDFDGDGDFDLIVCNLAHPRYIGFSNRTMLYRNDNDAKDRKPEVQSLKPFVNVRKEWGIKYEECHSEPNWGDFDNDGDLDLFITSVYPNRRSFLYENKGDRFEDVTFLAGVRIFNGWGCATSDYDNDGMLDLAACEGGKVELFRNTTENNFNWIEIAPDRTPGVHLSQIGGIVEIEAGSKTLIRQFEGGKGAGSQNSGTLHFGLGKAKKCDVTLFNYGKSIEFKDLRANQQFEIGKETLNTLH